MCGITGTYAYHYAAPEADRQELRRISEYMAARGPDGSGEWLSPDGRVAFAHRRLAIIDLSHDASQPMQSADGDLVIVFNGEIYNHEGLRAKLESKGRRFRTRSDTEVLLQLYAEMGDAMVHELRGMFAFALWDRRRRGLFLARDPFGIKPLYYADDGWTVRFASQVKALLAGGGVSKEVEPAGVAGFYLFGSVPEPFTMHREIRALPAGATLWVDEVGPHEARRYFSVADTLCQAEGEALRPGPPELQRRCREALLDTVRHHLVSDVPVGLFLSAGIDSGALLGLMRDLGRHDIQAVTLAFGEFQGTADDEAPIAAEVAERYGARHTTRVVTFEDFRDELPKVFAAMDQPSIDGLNTWFVSQAASELGLKVAVSGLGGDELFGGYPSFRDVPRWVRSFWVPSHLPPVGRALRFLGDRTLRAWPVLSPKSAGLFELGGTYAGAYLIRRGIFMPWDLPALMGAELARVGLRRLRPLAHIEGALEPMPATPFGRVAALEMSLYMRNQLLRDSDWAGMAHSVEIRVPLVDPFLLKCLAPMLALDSGASQKSLLGRSPSRSLPEKVLGRRKTGFQTPVQNWLRRTLSAGLAPGGGTSKDKAQHWSRLWAPNILKLGFSA